MTFKYFCLCVATVGLCTPLAFFAFYWLYLLVGGWVLAYVTVVVACLVYGLTE